MSRAQRNPRLALRCGAAQALAPPRGSAPAPEGDPAPRGPNALPPWPGKKAPTIKNVNVCVSSSTLSSPESGGGRPWRPGSVCGGPRLGSGEAAAGCPRRPSRSRRGRGPRALRASGPGPGSPGRDDRGREDRPRRAPTSQTRRPRARPSGCERPPLVRYSRWHPAGSLTQAWRPITARLSDHARALSARPGRGRGGRGSAP